MDTPTEPQTLTVEEAARVLRIGRTTAYALAREWRTTHGRSVLPVLELGRSPRLPRAALAHLLDASEVEAPRSPTARGPAQRLHDRRPKAASRPGAQGRGGASTPNRDAAPGRLWPDMDQTDS